MGIAVAIAVAINIFVLFFIGIITFLTFRNKTDKNESILSAIKRTWSSQSSVDKAIKGTKYGDLGSFDGHESSGVEMYGIGAKQDNLLDFMNQLKPDRIGT